MKKTLSLALTDEELIELYRVLVDKDAEGALAFLENHARKQVVALLEGG